MNAIINDAKLPKGVHPSALDHLTPSEIYQMRRNARARFRSPGGYHYEMIDLDGKPASTTLYARSAEELFTRSVAAVIGANTALKEGAGWKEAPAFYTDQAGDHINPAYQGIFKSAGKYVTRVRLPSGELEDIHIIATSADDLREKTDLALKARMSKTPANTLSGIQPPDDFFD